MHRDQLARFLYQLFGGFQPRKNFGRDPFSLFGVGVEISVAEIAEGLSAVVQQRGEADFGRGLFHAAEGVLQHVVAVKVRALG